LPKPGRFPPERRDIVRVSPEDWRGTECFMAARTVEGGHEANSIAVLYRQVPQRPGFH
jgi:hypothetical protein